MNLVKNKLKVIHIPQVPMKGFEVEVRTVESLNGERKGIGAVKAIEAQGTDPEFFGLDENGDDFL